MNAQVSEVNEMCSSFLNGELGQWIDDMFCRLQYDD